MRSVGIRRFHTRQIGIPPPFLNLLDRATEAAKYFKPLDEPAIAQLKQMAENRSSLFAREEQSVARNRDVRLRQREAHRELGPLAVFMQNEQKPCRQGVTS